MKTTAANALRKPRAVKVQYGPRKGERRVCFLLFLDGEMFAIVRFAGRGRGAGKLRKGQLRLLGRGGITHTWRRLRATGRDTHSSSVFLQPCVCVQCQWAVTADGGGSSFLGEFRDLDQGIFASIKTLHFQLTRSDYPIKPV